MTKMRFEFVSNLIENIIKSSLTLLLPLFVDAAKIERAKIRLTIFIIIRKGPGWA